MTIEQERLTPTQEDRTTMRDALTKARDQFLFYEQSHLAKYAPWDLDLLRKGVASVLMGRDAYEKALVNAEMAAMCDAALKSPPIAGGEGDLSPTMTLRDAHAMQFEALLDDVPETWARVGYKSEAEEIADMANVGRALMEALPVGYHYSDCPSEIVADLQNQITAQPAEECVGGVGVSPEAARSSARKVNEWISRALDGTTSNDVSRMVETLQLSARTAFDGGVVIEPVILTEAATLLTQMEAREQALREALEAVGTQAVDWYKKRNGHRSGIQDESGEKCWIVPDDAMRLVRALLNPTPTEER